MLKTSPSTRPARMETARQPKAVASTRRLLLTAGLLAGVALPMDSSAKDYKDAKEEKEARRKKLREAMEVQAKTGKAQEAFQQPEYSVPEEARTSNWSGDRFAGNQMEKGNQ